MRCNGKYAFKGKGQSILYLASNESIGLAMIGESSLSNAVYIQPICRLTEQKLQKPPSHN